MVIILVATVKLVTRIGEGDTQKKVISNFKEERKNIRSESFLLGTTTPLPTFLITGKIKVLFIWRHQ